jgi:Raf kinase inhibitor-like YbhB/YbcL family protein
MKVKWLRGGYTVRRVALWMTLLTIIAVGAVSCTVSEPELPDEGEMTLSLSSPVFQEGEGIPITYTCDGQDISPPLTWGEPPSETQSFALIMDDPDAPGGVFTHWLLFNLPADSRELPEAVPPHNELENGALQGKNGFNEIGYGGPCPPPGSTHHYRFTIYALDQALDLMAGAPRKQVIDAITGHILAWGQLTGIYQR